MRICIIYDCLYPYTVGGAERWYGNVAKRLAQEGHEVTYLTLRQWDRGVAPQLDGVRVISAGPRMDLYVGERRRILPPLVFGIGVLWHLLRHGRRYDAVHSASFPYFSLLGAGAARPLGGYELVVDWHEVWSAAYWRQYLGAVGGRVGHAVQTLCARIPQRAFCFSQLHAERLRGEGLRGQVTVLRGQYAGRPHAEHADAGAGEAAAEAGAGEPAAGTGAAAVADPFAEPTVVFAGRLIPEKRAPLAVAAVVAARARVPTLRAIVYGDGPEREALLAEIAAHDAGGYIKAPGFAAAAELDMSLRAAACMLLTSSREGYGNIVVEACAVGGPPTIVVAGDDNAATELIENSVNGLIAPDADAQTIADAIVAVYAAGPDMRASTARWFEANAEKLSLETSLKAVLASYKRAGTSAAASA
jgi:glycosyltransferase involved in cell wall biosynthesis